MQTVQTLIRLRVASLTIQNVLGADSDQTVQADLNHRWVLMSDGTFLDVAVKRWYYLRLLWALRLKYL